VVVEICERRQAGVGEMAVERAMERERERTVGDITLRQLRSAQASL
jgi:hypothetical protein